MELDGLQIQVPNTAGVSDVQLPRVWDKKYHNESNDLVLGFDPLSKDAIKKKAIRAKRFGIKKDEEMEVDKNPFMDVVLDNIKWPPFPTTLNGELRSESLLVYGVQDMSTKDIFAYFKLFGADTVEWIDDFSCNVVWEFASSATTALKAKSRTYEELIALQGGERVADTPIESNEIKKAKEVWRIGLPWTTGAQLFLRQSTMNDRKLPGAASRSYYYLKYGKDGHQTGLVSSSRKRKLDRLTKTAIAKMDPSEPDVKFMDIGSDDVEQTALVDRMEVDPPSEPILKRSRLHPSQSLYSDRDRGPEGDVFGRLGQQSHRDTRHESLQQKDKKSIHDRLGPLERRSHGVKDRLSDLSPSGGQVLDLRTKLKRSQESKEGKKLLNLSIEISEFNKSELSAPLRRKEERHRGRAADKSESESSDDSDSDSDSESEPDQKAAEDNKKSDDEDSSEGDSSSSSGSSSSTSDEESDSDESNKGNEHDQENDSDSDSSSSTDSDTGRRR